MKEVDLSKYENHKKSMIPIRVLFSIVWTIFARPFPRRTLNKWKVFILKFFGADVKWTSVVYSSASIYYPSNLVMGEYSCLASKVNCYNVDKIIIGDNATISQGTYICTASHDISKPQLPLITKPIVIKDQVWVAADAFIGMGLTIGEGAVVGARAVVTKDVESWTVVGGNPAKFIKKRVIK